VAAKIMMGIAGVIAVVGGQRRLPQTGAAAQSAGFDLEQRAAKERSGSLCVSCLSVSLW